MKLAIHHRSEGFSERWIEYCESNSINYKIVDCYKTDIIEQMSDCYGLMWHWHQSDPKAVLFARQLIYSLEAMGKLVFPNFYTCWHFDDKVGQKYLLEAINAPLIPSYVFYDKKDAINWAKGTSYPKVNKLRGGASSQNVRLVKDFNEALRIINKAFGKGFSQFNRLSHIQESFRRYKESKFSLLQFAKSTGRIFISPQFSKVKGKERGYVYFQNYVENEGYDVRVVVIDNKAVALKRLVRDNDFRASGSGNLVFENETIDTNFLKIAFKTSDKLKSQSLAIDFIKSLNGEILIVEISYGFPTKNFLDRASGYWDKKLYMARKAIQFARVDGKFYIY